METQVPIPTENLVNQEERRKQRRFTLSTSNKIFYLLLALLLIGLYIAVPVKTPESLGVLVGTLLSFFIYSWLIAWVVWWIRGKKLKGGVWTFNIVLALIVLGQIGQISRRGQKTQVVQEMQKAMAEFHSENANQGELGGPDHSLENLADAADKGFGRMSELSNGEENRYYAIMRKYTSDSFAMGQGWVDCTDALQSPRIFNLSNLDEEEEVEHQKEILTAYVNKTIEYREFFVNMVPELRKRLEVLDEEDEFVRGLVRGSMKGIARKYRSEEPVCNPLIQSHIQYGSGMIQIIDLLIENREGWAYEGEDVQFINVNLQREFNKKIQTLIENEKKIDALTAQLEKLQ